MRKDYQQPVTESVSVCLEENFVSSVDMCAECKDTDCPNYKGQSLTALIG